MLNQILYGERWLGSSRKVAVEILGESNGQKAMPNWTTMILHLDTKLVENHQYDHETREPILISILF